MKWTAFAALLTSPAILAAQAQDCVVHVWPSSSSAANTGGWLSNLGIAGALADYERNKDANLRDQVALIEGLAAPVQARLISEARLPELLGLSGARLRFESQRLARGSAKKVKGRRSASTASCYAELIVSLNHYQQSAVYGRQLTTHFTYKDFRKGRPRMVSAKLSSPVPHFPPASPQEAALAQRELLQAFSANLLEFTQKIRKRMARR